MGINRRMKRARQASRARVLGNGYGGVKMSEVLLDVAEPLVEGFSLPEDRKEFVAALKIAGLLWNEAAHPGAGGSEKLYAELSALLGEARDPELESLFDAVIRRARLLYPDLDRTITSVHVAVDDDGACNVRVMSVV